jgi:hypothetical protein
MGATLDGVIAGNGAVLEAKFMLPWSFSEEAAAEKHMAQVQHNMWVTNARDAALSIITGGGKWVEIKIAADPLYQHLLLTAEKKFWRCVESGEPPHLFTVEPPRPRIEAIRIVDMSSSNSWAEFAAIFRNTRAAFLDHERAKTELKTLMPEDAKEAIGHGGRPWASPRSGQFSICMKRAPSSMLRSVPSTSGSPNMKTASTWISRTIAGRLWRLDPADGNRPAKRVMAPQRPGHRKGPTLRSRTCYPLSQGAL